MTTRVLMVCLGNICRSPTAEAAMVEAASAAGVAVEVDSAGTAAYHVGEPPDARMVRAAAEVGLPVDGRARQVRRADFADFDLLVAMDRANQQDLLDLAADDSGRDKVRLLRDFTDQPGRDVPDPYYGGPDGFAEVVRIVRAGAAGLVAALRDGRA